jgi:HD-GYP domain-containing protein (c-di-GMP phosphodiesterase class II)
VLSRGTAALIAVLVAAAAAAWYVLDLREEHLRTLHERDDAIGRRDAASAECADLQERLAAVERERDGAREEARRGAETFAAALVELGTAARGPGESDRIAALAAALARRAGLTDREVTAVRLAAAVSGIDLIPAARTPGGREDPVEGAASGTAFAARSRVLGELGVPGILAALGENWDGSGGPGGLAGEAIPVGARVLALACSYNELVSERPGRAAMSPAQALDRIAEQSGSRFEPRLAGVFTEVVRDGESEDPGR